MERQESQAPSSLPLIVLPAGAEEGNSNTSNTTFVAAATPTDALNLNPDFVALKKVLEESKSSPGGDSTQFTEEKIVS